MDLSGIIFVAVAVAWASYLIPKALKHQDDVARSRPVDRFSHTMRVLARREAVSPSDARLVVTPTGDAPSSQVQTQTQDAPAPDPARLRARRQAAKVAARRRRRVLLTLLFATAVTGGVAAYGLIGWGYVGIPAGLIVVWLVLCRVMVRSEIRTDRAVLGAGVVAQSAAPAAASPEAGLPEIEEIPEDYQVIRNEQGFDEVTPEAETSVSLTAADPDAWDPVPTTLPTYVGKATAVRPARTIDLDSSGVWTSGRTEIDAEIARQADAERAARHDGGEAEEPRRAVGS